MHRRLSAHNKIERTWLDLHANVTRNQACLSMDELTSNVRRYLRNHNQQQRSVYALKA